MLVHAEKYFTDQTESYFTGFKAENNLFSFDKLSEEFGTS